MWNRERKSGPHNKNSKFIFTFNFINLLFYKFVKSVYFTNSKNTRAFSSKKCSKLAKGPPNFIFLKGPWGVPIPMIRAREKIPKNSLWKLTPKGCLKGRKAEQNFHYFSASGHPFGCNGSSQQKRLPISNFFPTTAVTDSWKSIKRPKEILECSSSVTVQSRLLVSIRPFQFSSHPCCSPISNMCLPIIKEQVFLPMAALVEESVSFEKHFVSTCSRWWDCCFFWLHLNTVVLLYSTTHKEAFVSSSSSSPFLSPCTIHLTCSPFLVLYMV